MADANSQIDLSPLGMLFTVLKTGAETNGASLDLHWDLHPGCNMKDPLVHVHPNAIETYDILEGEMEFFVKDKWIKARTGDHVSVPVGVTHAFRNPTAKTVKVFNTHQPALRMESYFRDVVKVLDRVTAQRTRAFRMNLNTMLYMSVLMNNYRPEIIAIDPPDAALRIMGIIGRMAGLRY